MKNEEKAALLACLASQLEEEEMPVTGGPERLWPAAGQPQLAAAWNHRSADCWRLSGRLRLHRARRPGRS